MQSYNLGVVNIHPETIYNVSANQTQTHELPASGLYICALRGTAMYNLVLVSKGQQGLTPLVAGNTWSGGRVGIEPNNNSTFKTTCDNLDRVLSFYCLFK